ncbi:MAG: pyrroline-5-carboxylate reductase [Spirochaetes bacterium]|jgi:pyrroline-5-carboxylate reductase|nr:pyrroline-5-carboxylate reductase [Spirochaetota bacterium]
MTASELKGKFIGFIGAGNMAGAMITGLSDIAREDRLSAYDIDSTKLIGLSDKYGVEITPSLEALAAKTDIIIIAVKPDAVPAVCDGIRDAAHDDRLIISIAAGISTASLEKMLGQNKKIVRAMPNTPLLAGEGMTVITAGKNATGDDMKAAEEIFSRSGRAITLPEKMMDAVTGISGSGPAYVFTFIQAMADGGVKHGIPRDKAVLLAAQTVLGSAKLVLQTGEEPFTLRGRVTSPGGTTIEAVHVLERGGFSGIVMDAIEAAAQKSRKLGEK